ncbi:MAG: hypothetical protein HOQ43_02905, partial [Glycomyces artemisiae]|nr:hypothetical protein [Glycomyces artemisiae]
MGVGGFKTGAALGIAVAAGVALAAVPGPTSPASASVVVFTDGFESGNTSAWTSATGIVVQSSTVADGAFAARAKMSGTPAYLTKTLATPASEVSVSVAVDVAALPSAGRVDILDAGTDASTPAGANVFVS